MREQKVSHVQIFASDSFLALTEFTREEILGRNCRYELFFYNCYGNIFYSLTSIGVVSERAWIISKYVAI